MALIGVDIGGTTMRAARFDDDFTLVERAQRPTLVEQGVDSIVQRLLALIEQVYPEDPQDLDAIGVAAPGPLDAQQGVILRPPNLPFDHTPLADIIKQHTGITTVLGNDADLVALGEFHLGAGRGANTMVYLTLSTGLGCGLIIDGRLHTGRGQAGEAGFMVIAPGDPVSGPERTGYAEYISSGTAIARRAREGLEAGRESLLREMVSGEFDRIEGRIVGEAAHRGDALAREVIEQAGRYAGILVASLLMLLHPDKVVIGGSVVALGDLLFDPLHAAVEEFCISPVYYEHGPITTAALGDDAGLVGAALLADEAA